jgi:hypothetical protein
MSVRCRSIHLIALVAARYCTGALLPLHLIEIRSREFANSIDFMIGAKGRQKRQKWQKEAKKYYLPLFAIFAFFLPLRLG